MSRAPARPRAEPLFLASARGPLFAIHHGPAGPARQALLYVHPFGDEMNRSRRMAALAARRMADAGVAVLQLDLYGCGDSAGEFADARWDIWLDDLATARAWLHARSGVAPGLWGLRLGALLALDFARRAAAPPRLLLWQPVTSGAAYLTQFLRLLSAGEMLREQHARGAQALRAALAGGETLEVGGYVLAPQLAAAIDTLDAGAMAPAAPVDWFALAPGERALTPAIERLVAAWRDAGTPVTLHALREPAFWDSQELIDCPALLDATVAALHEPSHV